MNKRRSHQQCHCYLYHNHHHQYSYHNYHPQHLEYQKLHQAAILEPIIINVRIILTITIIIITWNLKHDVKEQFLNNSPQSTSPCLPVNCQP